MTAKHRFLLLAALAKQAAGCERHCATGLVPLCQADQQTGASTTPDFRLSSVCKECGCSGQIDVDFKDLGDADTLADCEALRSTESFCGAEFVFGSDLCFCRSPKSPCDQLQRPGSGWEVFQAIEKATCQKPTEELILQLGLRCDGCMLDTELKDNVSRAVADEAKVTLGQIANATLTVSADGSLSAAAQAEFLAATVDQTEFGMLLNILATDDVSAAISARLSDQGRLGHALESLGLGLKLASSSVSVSTYPPVSPPTVTPPSQAVTAPPPTMTPPSQAVTAPPSTVTPPSQAVTASPSIVTPPTQAVTPSSAAPRRKTFPVARSKVAPASNMLTTAGPTSMKSSDASQSASAFVGSGRVLGVLLGAITVFGGIAFFLRKPKEPKEPKDVSLSNPFLGENQATQQHSVGNEATLTKTQILTAKQAVDKQEKQKPSAAVELLREEEAHESEEKDDARRKAEEQRRRQAAMAETRRLEAAAAAAFEKEAAKKRAADKQAKQEPAALERLRQEEAATKLATEEESRKQALEERARQKAAEAERRRQEELAAKLVAEEESRKRGKRALEARGRQEAAKAEQRRQTGIFYFRRVA